MLMTKSTRVSCGVVLALVISVPAWADDNLHINGFLTAGVTGGNMKSAPACASTATFASMQTASCSSVTNSSNPLQYAPGYAHIGAVPNWTNDSILGLQASYKIDNATSMVAQLVSYGSQNYQVNTVWAYATYRPTENTEWRIGRQRLPFYMYSEQLDVGMSYPWARPPLEMYSLPVNQYDGISWRWNWQWNDLSGNINLLTGDSPSSSNSPYLPLGFDIKNQRGFNFNIFENNWTFHGSVTAGDVNINVNDDQTPGHIYNALNTLLVGLGRPGIAAQTAAFYDLGAVYDDGQWLGISELSDLRYGDGSILQDPLCGYVLIGYHFGQWMPDFTISKMRTNSSGNQNRAQDVATLQNAGVQSVLSKLGVSELQQMSAMQSIANNGGEETSYILGLRYDISPKMSVKLEWDHVTGFGASPDGLPGGGWGMFSDAPVGGKADIYTFVVNAMF